MGRIVALFAACLAVSACTPAAAAGKPAVKPCHGQGARACPTSSPTPSPTVSPTPAVSPTPIPTTTSASPAPTTTPPAAPLPTVPAGTVVPTSLAFADDFDTLDTGKWSVDWCGGGTINNVKVLASNVSVHDGQAWLKLSADAAGTITGGVLHTDTDPNCNSNPSGRYALPVGGFTEARIWFPGDAAQQAYNWPAWWTSGPSWPRAGEHDVAEAAGWNSAGRMTVNYHSPTVNDGTTPAGMWINAFHVFGLYRGAGYSDFYWDGVLVWHVVTADNGQPEELILNAGRSDVRAAVTGDAGAVRVDYVRAWD